MAEWDPKQAYHGDIADTAETLAYVLGDERSRYDEAAYDLLVHSYEVARSAHEGQVRASGEPYLIHCIETARILSDWRLDPATVSAALLHDTLEDSAMKHEELTRLFPTPIPELVDGVTKISKLNISSSQDRQIESLRKLILAMSDDLRVTLIKLGDRLHNMRTLDSLSKTQQQRISRSTLDIYAPLAHRLGIMRLQSELEDCSMKYLWPEDYRRIAQLVARKREHRDNTVRLSIRFLSKRLEQAGITTDIQGRSKHFYSIYRKMRDQGLEFDEIYDLIALRVVCDTVAQCYDILGHVHQMFPPVADRFKDYVAMPKENMYQSLHTTVIGLRGQVTEIQIRTHEMHRIAEYGVAAHWKYKEGVHGRAAADPRLLWLRRLTEWLTDVRDPNEFMSALRHEAFSDTIMVFTPKGDVIELPAGATPLDFAYMIHTDVGNHCDGAKVNHRVVPLKTKLKNGDVVEIVTRKTARPSVGWLDVVKTSRARSKIRHVLRTENFEQNVQRGHEAMARALKGRNIALPWADVVHKIEANLHSLRVHSVDELLSEIGFGAANAAAAVNRLFPPLKKIRKERSTAERQKAKRGKASRGVIIEGVDEGVINFARCCYPLPGDAIVGFITVGRGVTIHRFNCRNLRKSLENNPESGRRLLSAHWDKENPPVGAAEIRLILSDRRGLLADICNLMAAQEVFIVSSSTKSHNHGRAVMRFVIEVKNKDQLKQLVAALRAQRDVISISPDI